MGQPATKERATQRFTSRVNGQGRVVIPVEVREQAGITLNSMVTIEAMADGRIILTPAHSLIEEAQAIIRKTARPGPSVVDELIRERREEAARE